MRDIETQVLSQSHMETWFQKRLAPDFPRFQKGVIGRMRPRLLCCDYEAKESIMAYDVLDWELNLLGHMQNGIIATGFDTCMGMLCHYYATPNLLTTVTLSATYLQPVPKQKTLQYQTKIKSFGKSLVTLESVAYIAEEKKQIATATATFKILHQKKKGDTI